MLTIFSWGYWGWGSTTTQLVQAVDAAEEAGGFKPPIFVDVRLRRSVRAKGFTGKAFERVVGPTRYEWMPRLGNRNIATGESGTEIDDPTAAKELLARPGRRELQRSAPPALLLLLCRCRCADLSSGNRRRVTSRRGQKGGPSLGNCRVARWYAGAKSRRGEFGPYQSGNSWAEERPARNHRRPR